MAKFEALSDSQVQALGDRLIRNAKARIDSQVPAPGRNPFATGTLQRSVTYSWDKLSDGRWELTINYVNHGKFTNFGIRRFFNPAMVEQSFFGYAFRGYAKGKGGIRPQGWLSLRGDRPVYEAIVEAEIRTSWEEFLDNTISNLQKQS